MSLQLDSIQVLSAADRRLWGVSNLQDFPAMVQAMECWRVRDRGPLQRLLSQGRARLLGVGQQVRVCSLRASVACVELTESPDANERFWVPTSFLADDRGVQLQTQLMKEQGRAHDQGVAVCA